MTIYMSPSIHRFVLFFFNDTATTEIYTYAHTLSLHDGSSDLFAAVMRINIGSSDEARREFALRVLHGKIFLIGPHGELNHLRRHLQKYRIEMAKQRHGPFCKACVLGHHALVFPENQAGSGRCLFGFVFNEIGTSTRLNSSP